MKGLEYIQNRQHWCWAVACRMVGEQYKERHTKFDFGIIRAQPEEYGCVTASEYENGVVTDNTDGINWALQQAGMIRVDAWQSVQGAAGNTMRRDCKL